tara:strand:+ start:2470 stop:3552 length:1083 start_codon:yes stop_codon:yes gene_type:complete
VNNPLFTGLLVTLVTYGFVKAFRKWKDKRDLLFISNVQALASKNGSKLITKKFRKGLTELVEEHSQNVSDYDGFALWKFLLSKIPELSNYTNYNEFLNSVQRITSRNATLIDRKFFEKIGQAIPCLVIFHDLGLDPNSDDAVALLIARAIAIINPETKIILVSVAGNDDTRMRRTAFAKEICREAECLYLKVEEGVKPLPFIKGDALKEASGYMSFQDYIAEKKDELEGVSLFFCGHMEKGEIEIVMRLFGDGCVSFIGAQSPEKGGFNISPEDIHGLGKCRLFLWGKPTPISVDFYYSLFPEKLQEVNEISKGLMFTSEMSKFSRMVDGKWTTAGTRACCIPDAVSFYKAYHKLILDNI